MYPKKSEALNEMWGLFQSKNGSTNIPIIDEKQVLVEVFSDSINNTINVFILGFDNNNNNTLAVYYIFG